MCTVDDDIAQSTARDHAPIIDDQPMYKTDAAMTTTTTATMALVKGLTPCAGHCWHDRMTG